MTNRYEQSPPATKTFLTNVSIGVTILFLGGAGAMVLSHGSRLDKIEQHEIDTDYANAAALQRINENLNYIRSRMDSGGNHGSGNP